MKLKLFSLILVAMIMVITSSCSHGQVVTFKINNNSNQDIDKVEIFILGGLNKKFDSKIVDKIPKGEDKAIKWNVDDIVKTDGDFEIRIDSGENSRSRGFGYFSNGIHLSRYYYINITNDSIEISI